MANPVKKLLEKITPQMSAKLDETMGETFYETVALALISELPGEDMDALTEVLQSGDSEALEKFLRTRIPDMDAVIAESLLTSAGRYKAIHSS